MLVGNRILKFLAQWKKIKHIWAGNDRLAVNSLVKLFVSSLIFHFIVVCHVVCLFSACVRLEW
jgi:hypothetical protein